MAEGINWYGVSTVSFLFGTTQLGDWMPDYKGNFFGVNRYSVKFIQSQRDLTEEEEMLGKRICSERLCYSPPLRTKEYREGKSLCTAVECGGGGLQRKQAPWC